jgi:CBS domain-containing protein
MSGAAMYATVDQYMTTDLFTVGPDAAVAQVAALMDRERIRHVPVEDAEHRLLGLVSYRSVLRVYTAGRLRPGVTVADIVETDLITVTPQTPTLEAIATLRRYRIGCLPVLDDGRLVGIVSEENFMDIAAELLERKLNE